MIPKIIHYCWLSNDKKPESIRKCIDSWRKYLPDFELRLWDINSFDYNAIPFTREALAAKKWAFVSDYIRLLALWKEPGLYDRFKRDFYVYTDPDLEIDKGCPSDFMSFFLETLKNIQIAKKSGSEYGLMICLIIEKESVIQWEKQHWEIPYGDLLFKARIDTTFALYRPFCKGGHSSHLVFRTGAHYLIRHLPWYQDSSDLSKEDIYYISNSRQSTMWTSKLKQ